MALRNMDVSTLVFLPILFESLQQCIQVAIHVEWHLIRFKVFHDDVHDEGKVRHVFKTRIVSNVLLLSYMVVLLSCQSSVKCDSEVFTANISQQSSSVSGHQQTREREMHERSKENEKRMKATWLIGQTQLWRKTRKTARYNHESEQYKNKFMIIPSQPSFSRDMRGKDKCVHREYVVVDKTVQVLRSKYILTKSLIHLSQKVHEDERIEGE